MNMETAQQIADIVTQLAVVVSQYQAKFGRTYRIVETAHPDAIQLHREMRTHQANISNLLDLSALEAAVETQNSWWQRTDLMDTATVSELVKHVYHLISGCAYPDNQYNLTVIQSIIAGFIEPEIRYQVAYQMMDIQATG